MSVSVCVFVLPQLEFRTNKFILSGWSRPASVHTEELRRFTDKWTNLWWMLNFDKGDQRCTLLKKKSVDNNEMIFWMIGLSGWKVKQCAHNRVYWQASVLSVLEFFNSLLESILNCFLISVCCYGVRWYCRLKWIYCTSLWRCKGVEYLWCDN